VGVFDRGSTQTITPPLRDKDKGKKCFWSNYKEKETLKDWKRKGEGVVKDFS